MNVLFCALVLYTLIGIVFYLDLKVMNWQAANDPRFNYQVASVSVGKRRLLDAVSVIAPTVSVFALLASCFATMYLMSLVGIP